MPPPNTTFGTAIDLGVLPASVVQDVHELGVAYTVWYRYTVPADVRLVLFFARDQDMLVYLPRTEVWTLVAGVPTSYLSMTSSVDNNRAIQVPVTPGETYYFSLAPDTIFANPAVLLLDAEIGPRLPVPIGSIFVNDDTDGFPGVFVSQATGTVLNVVHPFPAGEAGDRLPSGISLLSDVGAGQLRLYDPQFNLITPIPFNIATSLAIRAQQTLGTFFVGRATNPAVVRQYSAAGVQVSTHTLTVSGISGIAANNAGTILYHTRSVTAAPVLRWDLVSDVALSNLAAGVAGHSVSDILVLLDDTIVVLYYNFSTQNLEVRRYDAAGTLLNTYALGVSGNITIPRLAYALADPDTFWVWSHSDPTGFSIFREIRVSDGVVLTTVGPLAEYEVGVYQPGQTLTPTARSGISFSCPFFVLPGAIPETNTDQTLLVVAPVPPGPPGPPGGFCPLPLPPDSGGGMACSAALGLPDDTGGGGAEVGY